MIGIRCPYCGTANIEAAARDARSFVCMSCGKAVEPPLRGQSVVPPPPLPSEGRDDRRWSDGPPAESADRWSTVAPLGGGDDSSSSVSLSQSSILPPDGAEEPPLVRPPRSPLLWLLLVLVLFTAALIGVIMLARNVRPWLDARRAAAQRAKVEYWFPQLDDGGDDARKEAAQAIVALGPRAVVVTLEHISKDPGEGQPFMFVTGAIDALAAVGPDAVAGLCEGLRSPEARVRAAAASILQEMGPAAKAARDGLVAALDDDNRWVREYAIDALGNLGGEAAPAAKRLAELAAPSDSATSARGTRRHALDALGHIGPEAREVLPALVTIAAGDLDVMVRDRASMAVKQIDVERLAREARGEADGPLKKLLKALHGEDSPAAIEAAEKLGDMGFAAEPAAAGLAEMLHHADAARRAAAATALGRLGLGAADFIPTLESAAADDDPDVRVAVAKALKLINDKPK